MKSMTENKYNAYITIFGASPKSGCGALAGVKAAVEDSILIKDRLCTAGSKILENFIPPFSATVVERAEKAGITFTGKTTLNEFLIGGECFREPAVNPNGTGQPVSGSAAAIASGSADIAFACDVNGAVRRDAAACGVYFLKPTYGTVSRYGLVSAAGSMEQIGIVFSNVKTGFSALEAVAGYDQNDGTSAHTEKYSYMPDQTGMAGLRVGVPLNMLGEHADGVKAFAQRLTALGAAVSYFDLAYAEAVAQVAYILSCAEFCNNISRFDGIKFGYRTQKHKSLNDIYVNSRSECLHPVTKAMAMAGARMLTSENLDARYFKAAKVRRLIKNSVSRAFQDFDCLLLPAGSIEAKNASCMERFRTNYRSAQYGALANLTGCPAVSLPSGGVQFMADCLDEKTLRRVCDILNEGEAGR